MGWLANRKLGLTLCSLLGCATVSGCANVPARGAGGGTYTLSVGESASLGDDLTLRFVGIEGDSRCPQGVQCIWAGRVDLTLSLERQGGTPQSFSLGLPPKQEGGTTLEGWTFELRQVNPYPREGVDLKASDYRIELRVSSASP